MRGCRAGVAAVRDRKGKDLRERQRCHQAGVPEQGIRTGSTENAPVRYTARAVQLQLTDGTRDFVSVWLRVKTKINYVKSH
jgi:hypothetical protein